MSADAAIRRWQNKGLAFLVRQQGVLSNEVLNASDANLKAVRLVAGCVARRFDQNDFIEWNLLVVFATIFRYKQSDCFRVEAPVVSPYRSLLVGEVHQPTFLNDLATSALCVLNGLYDSHEWYIGTWHCASWHSANALECVIAVGLRYNFIVLVC